VLIGYARVSTADQNPDHQVDALRRAGVAARDVYIDHASGAKASRPQLDIALRTLREGDTLKITRLDRLGRSVLHLVTLGAELRERGVGLHVIEQGIDTTTAEGRAMFGMLSRPGRAPARTHRREHTRRARRRPRPRTQRRPPPTAQHRAGHPRPTALRRRRPHTVQQIADLFSVPRTTVYGHLDDASKGRRLVHRKPISAAAASAG